jgi:CheY-like chemotaxis protein
MSVAYGIVTRHDGTIDVKTELGEGTKFTLGFPVCNECIEAKGGDGASLPHLIRTGRILVIDDETSIAQLLEDALSGVGHSVEIAVSGREGVEMATMSEFDLVLTDLGMPDISGWEVAATIRRHRPDVPIVLVTGWGTTLSKEEVERSGVCAVVHKPFEIQELLDTTDKVLRLDPRDAGRQN